MSTEAQKSSAPTRFIDLSSDTASTPSDAMYQAMMCAPLGDEQKRTDPSVNALCERVAALLGKEAGVFLPSGVMCNLIGILTQAERGDEVIVGEISHLLNMEGGAPAAVACVALRSLEGPQGIFDADSVRRSIRAPGKKKVPRTALVAIEQTCNRGGGSVWPLEIIQEIAEICRNADVAMHMDGARLLNASVATGISPRDYAEPFDSVWIDLSKGLGCPVGAVLTGPRTLIDDAWLWKHRLGGAMRQAGVLAAAGLYALDHYAAQLLNDHQNAQRLADDLRKLPGVRLVWELQTNMVYFDVSGTSLNAQQIASALFEMGVIIGVESESTMRAVTHLNIASRDIDTAVGAMDAVLQQAAIHV